MLKMSALVLLTAFTLACSSEIPPIASTPLPTATALVEFGSGGWFFTKALDPLDDSESVFAHLIAIEGKGRLGKDIILTVGCNGQVFNSIISWGWYLGTDEFISLDIRWDDAEARTERWRISGKENIIPWPPRLASLGPDAGNNAQIFANQIRKSERLVVRATPYDELPVTTIFDLRGSDAAVQRIIDTCPS